MRFYSNSLYKLAIVLILALYALHVDANQKPIYNDCRLVLMFSALSNCTYRKYYDLTCDAEIIGPVDNYYSIINIEIDSIINRHPPIPINLLLNVVHPSPSADLLSPGLSSIIASTLPRIISSTAITHCIYPLASFLMSVIASSSLS